MGNMGLTDAKTSLIRQTNKKDLLSSTENYIQYLVINYTGKNKRTHTHMHFPGGLAVKNPPAMQ